MGTCEVSIRLGKATPPNRFLQPRYSAMIRFKLKLLSEPIKNSHFPTLKCYLLYAFNLKPRILAMKSKNKSVKRRMPYDFEMECKTMTVSKKPNLEIGNTFRHPSSTDVGRCGSGFPLNMHIVGEDIVISSSNDCHIDNDSSTEPIHTSCMTNNARTEATELLSDSCSQVQLNKTKSEVTFSGKQNPFAKGKNLMNTQLSHLQMFFRKKTMQLAVNNQRKCTAGKISEPESIFYAEKKQEVAIGAE
ncbi:hypothetical protein Tco_1324980, partial [Tanacetum coccineum]